MWKMKAIIASLLLSTFLTACNIQTVQQYEDERAEKSEKVVEAEPQSKENEPEKAKASKEESDDKKSVASNEKKENTATEQPIETKPESSSVDMVTEKEEQPLQEAKTSENVPPKPNTTQKPIKTEKPAEKPVKPDKPVQSKPNKEPSKPNNTKPPVSKPKPTPPKPVEKPAKKEYAMISIGMKVLLQPENYEKLPKALQNPKYVPENGVIVSGAKIEIEKGDTAWDAISQLRAKYGIPIDYVNNPLYGVYIKGINHVYEFDAGEMSGWMYTVNGVKAPVGVGTYKLKDGDSISLQYTTNGGTDLGW